MSPLVFKIAAEPWEFEQIHRLNYRTFVEEIPQHPKNPEGRLVDKFHAENTYVIALRGQRLAGMVCYRAQRPFSLDSKLDHLDSYLPPGHSACEIRLLAVQPEERQGPVFAGLLKTLVLHCRKNGHTLAVVSAAVRQQKLYRHLGSVPFGPLVGTAEAPYQPMYLTLESFQQSVPWMPTESDGDITRASAGDDPA
jgi:hypothetical protein